MIRQIKIRFQYLLFIVLVGCSTAAVQTSEIGNKITCSNKVLIATQPTEFKNRVVAEMEKSLQNDLCYIKRISISHLNDEPTADYDVIAILGAYTMMSYPSEVKEFLNKIPEKEKLVMLITAGSPEKVDKTPQIDAFSSASVLTKSTLVAKKMVKKVQLHLGSKN